MNPNSAEAHYHRALFLESCVGDVDGALAEYLFAVEHDPAYSMFLFLLTLETYPI